MACQVFPSNLPFLLFHVPFMSLYWHCVFPSFLIFIACLWPPCSILRYASLKKQFLLHEKMMSIDTKCMIMLNQTNSNVSSKLRPRVSKYDTLLRRENVRVMNKCRHAVSRNKQYHIAPKICTTVSVRSYQIYGAVSCQEKTQPYSICKMKLSKWAPLWH